MKGTKIKVLYFPVGGDSYICEIENCLKSMQELVKGYIEVFVLDKIYGSHFSSGALAILNEEGKFTPNIKPNRNVYFGDKLVEKFYGDFFICGSNNKGVFISVTSEQEDYYKKIFTLRA